MLRLYKSPVVGDGKTTETAFRPKVAIYGIGHSSIIPKGSTFAISLVEADDFSKLEADPDIYRMSKELVKRIAGE